MTARVTTLANGLRVVSETMPGVQTVSAGVWIGIGARNERPEINGVSHLLEHMAFKGTRRRTAEDIAREIEDVGGAMNAYTARENTAYYCKVLKEHAGLAIDVLADIVQHSTLPEDELARERAVVVQEIHQTHDTPDDVIFDHFQETAFPDQALGRSILGPAEVVSAMSRDQVIGYMRHHYSAPQMVVSAAGAIEHEDLVAMVSAAFTELPAAETAETDPGVYEGGEARFDKDLEQVHLLLGFEGVKFHGDDYFATALMSNILGGGMSSRLFQEVREKRGLAYSVYSYHHPFQDCGLFGIYAGTTEKEAAELVPVVCDEIVKIRNSVSDAELARAKAQYKASLLMVLENTSARCEQLARQMLVFGKPLSTEQILARIDAMNTGNITGVANRIFSSSPTLAAIGPLSQTPRLASLSARLAA